MEKNTFDFYYSLGWNCSSAGSMAKNGLRGVSGPFDWYFSELRGVIKTLETDFGDFLNIENIKYEPVSKPKEFEDTKYGFVFNHDIKYEFFAEYEGIKSKYARRIDRFRSQSGGKIGFIRFVKNSEEVFYINSHFDYIKRVLESYNANNEIIFFKPRWITEEIKVPFRNYVLNIDDWGDGFFSARSAMDNNQDEIRILQRKIKKDSIIENLMFDKLDLENKLQEMMESNNSCFMRRKVKSLISRANGVKCDKCVIYGCGDNGKDFYMLCKRCGCKVEAFIDAKPLMNQYDGIPIVDLRNQLCLETKLIVVIPTYDYDKVFLTIRKKINNAIVRSVEDVLI